MLDHSDHTDDGYYSDADHLQPNVQPLHGSITVKETALILFQTPLILLLKSALKHTNIPLCTALQSLSGNYQTSGYIQHLSLN